MDGASRGPGAGSAAGPAAGAGPVGTGGIELGADGGPGAAGSEAHGGQAGSDVGVEPEAGFGGEGEAPDPSGGAGGSDETGGSGTGSVVPVPGGSGGAAGPVLELVDDFETPDVYGLYQQQRKPLWYLFNDGTTGTQEPTPLAMTPLTAGSAPVVGSTSALFVSCSGFSDWGSGVGVDLVNATAKQPYDLSAYAGISFWAKMPGSYRQLRVNLPDAGTDPSGELCGDACNDHFGADVLLSDEWQHYEIAFGEMQQVGWGLQREQLTLEAVYSIHFQIASGNDVDLWIDDLGLIVQK